ncbi:MFS transporter [Candidatus Latescibacterota bacterium]
MRIKKLSFFFLAHMTSDLYPGMLSPLLPLLLPRYGLSMAMAGFLVMILQMFCNLPQPVVGILNDHRPTKLYLWAGIIVSAVPFCFMFQYGKIELMIVALAVSGIGVGMFHPVAAVAAGQLSKENRRGISMAIFSAGGTFGFTIAPLVMVVIVEILGEKFMPLVVLPALVMGIYFILDRGIVISEHHHLSFRERFAALKESKRELLILWLISSFRAVVHMLVGSFLPLLYMARGASYATSAYFLSGSLFASMIGMFAGGHLSDVHGCRKIIAITLFVTTPLLYLFLVTTGALSAIMLLLGMAVLSSTIPVNIVLAQRTAPGHPAIASSLVMGLSFAMGALAAWPFGALADRMGIENAMYLIIIIPALAGFLVFFLKKE